MWTKNERKSHSALDKIKHFLRFLQLYVRFCISCCSLTSISSGKKNRAKIFEKNATSYVALTGAHTINRFSMFEKRNKCVRYHTASIELILWRKMANHQMVCVRILCAVHFVTRTGNVSFVVVIISYRMAFFIFIHYWIHRRNGKWKSSIFSFELKTF